MPKDSHEEQIDSRREKIRAMEERMRALKDEDAGLSDEEKRRILTGKKYRLPGDDKEFVRAKEELRVREREQLLTTWMKEFAVSCRTAARWYNDDMRPAVWPVAEDGPFITIKQAAGMLGRSQAALSKSLQRSRTAKAPGPDELIEHLVVAVRWKCNIRTVEAYAQERAIMIIADEDVSDNDMKRRWDDARKQERKRVAQALRTSKRPIRRVSVTRLARYMARYPEKLSSRREAWLEMGAGAEMSSETVEVTAIDNRVTEPPRVTKPASVISEPEPGTPPFLMTANNIAEMNFGQWLQSMIKEWPDPKRSLKLRKRSRGQVRLVLRLSDGVILRAEFPEEPMAAVMTQILCHGKKVKQVKLLCENGQTHEFDL